MRILNKIVSVIGNLRSTYYGRKSKTGKDRRWRVEEMSFFVAGETRKRKPKNKKNLKKRKLEKIAPATPDAHGTTGGGSSKFSTKKEGLWGKLAPSGEIKKQKGKKGRWKDLVRKYGEYPFENSPLNQKKGGKKEESIEENMFNIGGDLLGLLASCRR